MFKYTKNPFGLFNNRLLLEPTTWNKKGSSLKLNTKKHQKTIEQFIIKVLEKCWEKEKLIPSDKIIKTLLFNYHFLDLSNKQINEETN